MEEYLILVNEDDKQWGKLEKLLAHQLGLLHRAFSIFIFNTKGEMLLQQRADGKYHSAGLWSNTCCGHPRFGEEIEDALKRRLAEEMGMECETAFAFEFVYKANLENGLIEHEYDHVFTGISDLLPNPDKSEVKKWKYENVENIRNGISNNPDQYTVWFKQLFEQVETLRLVLVKS